MLRGTTVEDNTSFYRDGSTAYEDSAQKTSLKIVTNTIVDRAGPARFNLPSIWLEASVATTDTIRIYILSATALTDADLWIEMMVPDGTNKHVGNWYSSGNLFNNLPLVPDVLATGTTLTTNTEVWTGRTTENRYHIDIPTSGDIGADCVPLIRMAVAKASLTMYVCTTPEVIA